MSSEATFNCVACGYDLRGLTEARCPECGLKFDPQRPPPADVPWLNRQGGSALLAYWRTVWGVVVHPRRFAQNVRRQVDVNGLEAEAFYRITLWLAAASVTLAVMLAAERASLFIRIRLAAATLPAALAFFYLASHWNDLVHPAISTFGAEMRYRRLQPFTCAALALSPAIPAAIWLETYGADEMLVAFCIAIVPALWGLNVLVFERVGGNVSWTMLALDAVLLAIFSAFMLLLALVIFVFLATCAFCLTPRM